MENLLLEKHPDLVDLLQENPNLKVYKILNISGNIVEYWEKNDNGNWVDQSEREKLREKIEAEQAELERLRRLEAYKQLASNNNEDDSYDGIE